MKLSRRAKRMDRHHRRSKRVPGLSLVSLMDIFTILVFFLLVSSQEVQDIPSSRAVTLPESVSLEKPRETVNIVVNDQDIMVGGEKVADVQQVLASPGDVIAPLQKALEEISARAVMDATIVPTDREITIMGDRQIPYRLLKKIMTTATEAKYNNISLAVLKKTNVDG